MYAEGWRPEKTLAHYRTLQALPLILGASRNADADYLDACRAKRNTVEYDMAGQTSPEEAAELIESGLRGDTLDWLRKRHPALTP